MVGGFVHVHVYTQFFLHVLAVLFWEVGVGVGVGEEQLGGLFEAGG